VDWIRDARRRWEMLSGTIDPERHADVARKLAIQERDAVWWRDAVLLYFQTFAHRPLPEGVEQPANSLKDYMDRSLIW
jgi:alpha-glucuronidase